MSCIVFYFADLVVKEHVVFFISHTPVAIDMTCFLFRTRQLQSTWLIFFALGHCSDLTWQISSFSAFGIARQAISRLCQHPRSWICLYPSQADERVQDWTKRSISPRRTEWILNEFKSTDFKSRRRRKVIRFGNHKALLNRLIFIRLNLFNKHSISRTEANRMVFERVQTDKYKSISWSSKRITMHRLPVLKCVDLSNPAL